MTDNVKTKTAAELMKDAAARAQQAKSPAAKDGDNLAAGTMPTPAAAPSVEEAAGSNAKPVPDEVVDKFPQRYQLPSAPSTIVFKDRSTGRVYKRIFADGVAKADNMLEHKKLEAMVASFCCYYYRGTKAQDSRQKMPDPVVAVEVTE